jgi:outer membrane protein insertion porin family
MEMSYYFPIWWKLVGHLRGFIGYGDSYSDTPNLPVQERFYLGGTNTIRGFRNFTIGPKDPVTEGNEGGNKAFYVNTEILFPLYEPLRLRGLVFFDTGNAFAEGTPFTWDVRYGAGVGIHFNSPFGNIRLEWGFNLDRQPNERLQVLHFSAGASF